MSVPAYKNVQSGGMEADCIPVGGSLDDLREWWQTFAVPARQITSRWHEFPPGHRVEPPLTQLNRVTEMKICRKLPENKIR